MVVLIHTGACAFHASVSRMPGAISSLISMASLSVEGLGLCRLCVSELCVSPVLVFSFGLELVPDFVPWGGARQVRDLPVARLPKILILVCKYYYL
jgi:hypothetical protein